MIHRNVFPKKNKIHIHRDPNNMRTRKLAWKTCLNTPYILCLQWHRIRPIPSEIFKDCTTYTARIVFVSLWQFLWISCFFSFQPDRTTSFTITTKRSETVQTYSFVLTGNNSKWLFGFCRHDINTQTAMVFITYLPWHDTFLKFINVLGELRRRSKTEFQAFLAETYTKGVPEPGSCLRLFYNSGLNVSSLNCFKNIFPMNKLDFDAK